MPRKKKAPSWTFDPLRLDECNLTELVQIARKMGFEHASIQIPRPDLEDLLLGAVSEIEDPLSDMREWTFGFLTSNTAIMHSQLSCSTHCPTCPHDRVVDCYATNFDKVIPRTASGQFMFEPPLPLE